MAEIAKLELSKIHGALALNNEHAKETSLLDEISLAELIKMAFYAEGVNHGATAFLIALDHSAKYVNPNFSWFAQRYESFVYIDRIIVAASARGRGLARSLYEDLFTRAKQAGYKRVVCEINLFPPNPASDAFHASMGFVEVGQATIHNGTKPSAILKNY